MINDKLINAQHKNLFEILNRMYEAGRREFTHITRVYDKYISDSEIDDYVRDLKSIGIDASYSLVQDAYSMISDFKMIFPYATYKYTRFIIDKMKENPSSYGRVEDCHINFREIITEMGLIKHKSLIDNDAYLGMRSFLEMNNLI